MRVPATERGRGSRRSGGAMAVAVGAPAGGRKRIAWGVSPRGRCAAVRDLCARHTAELACTPPFSIA